MRVRVGDRLVFVRMRVPHPGRQPWVNVRVMSIIVLVAVGVRHGLMGVLVPMAV